jgi:outer membrane protein assembly factor BamD
MMGCLLILLAGCGKWFDREDPMESLPVERMYEEAKDSRDGGNFGRATRYYQRLIARFPFGPYTEQAQLELAYTQYRDNKSEESLSTINRFIKTYPAHQNIAYAYYLKALVNFERGNPLLDRLARIDSTMRDQGSAVQSFNDFAEVIRRFPNTAYAADSRQRMIHLRNKLARYEINVARYYLRREANVAAVKRAQYVLEFYPQSAYQGDALAVMTEAYTRLGQDKLAADTRRVLELNAPDHPYLTGDWSDGARSWWRKIVPFAGENRG